MGRWVGQVERERMSLALFSILNTLSLSYLRTIEKVPLLRMDFQVFAHGSWLEGERSWSRQELPPTVGIKSRVHDVK